MKQFLFIIVTACFFVGCTPNSMQQNRVISNQTDITVYFTMGASEPYSLASGARVEKFLYGSDTPRFIDDASTGNQCVFYEQAKYDYNIKSKPRIKVTFYNAGTEDIIITEKNRLIRNDSPKIQSKGITISASETLNEVSIFTKTPVFSAKYEANGIFCSTSELELIKTENGIAFYKFSVK